MKKILFLIFALALLPISVFAKCSGDDIVTDYWGRTHGCGCDGGVDETHSKGHVILSSNPGKQKKCNRCDWTWWCNDRWGEEDGGWCPDASDGADSLITVIVMNEEKKCWARRCPEGSYFEGKSDGTVDYKKCISCNGLSQTSSKSDGICWNILCGENEPDDTKSPTAGKKFGTEVVIWNGKCMPVCDLQTVGAMYGGDSTYISIKIKSKNAGNIGRGLTDE
ncbi:MAG: hypothetical protein LBF28_01050 [Rickettsiales bacterium]|jgi:hypothetical protein|nr:hypothetical protein [Rickettsiales bacterium]